MISAMNVSATGNVPNTATTIRNLMSLSMGTPLPRMGQAGALDVSQSPMDAEWRRDDGIHLNARRHKAAVQYCSHSKSEINARR